MIIYVCALYLDKIFLIVISIRNAIYEISFLVKVRSMVNVDFMFNVTVNN